MSDEQIAGSGEAPEGAKQEQYGSFRLDALGVSGGSMLEGPPKRRLPLQGIVLATLCVVAAGALYAMRQLGMGPMGAVAEVKIDYDYNKAGAGADHQKLLADLSVSHVNHQVPADQVQKNPFRMVASSVAKPETPTTPTAKKDPEEEKRLKEERERADKIAAAIATLKVHTVLTGSVPVARIGDENVRVGDTVAQFFTVVTITGRTVELKVDGQIYILSLDDEVAGARPKRATSKKK